MRSLFLFIYFFLNIIITSGIRSGRSGEELRVTIPANFFSVNEFHPPTYFKYSSLLDFEKFIVFIIF